MTPPVLSRIAEQALIAIAGLNHTLQPDYAVLRVSSITELYVDDLLETLTSEYLKDDSEFETTVANVISAQLRQSWSERRKWLDSGFGISLSGTRVDQEFTLLIDLRNAIAHGGGRLTLLQKKKLATQLNYEDSFAKRLGAHCDGDQITCTPTTTSIAIRLASDYIRELDKVASPHLRMPDQTRSCHEWL